LMGEARFTWGDLGLQLEQKFDADAKVKVGLRVEMWR